MNEPISISFPEGKAPYPVKGDRDDQIDHTGFAAFNIAQNVYDVLKEDPERSFDKTKSEITISYKVENNYPAPGSLPEDAPTVDKWLDNIHNEEELQQFLKVGESVYVGPRRGKFIAYPRWKNKPMFSSRRAGI
jgi:hypothetical protein